MHITLFEVMTPSLVSSTFQPPNDKAPDNASNGSAFVSGSSSINSHSIRTPYVSVVFPDEKMCFKKILSEEKMNKEDVGDFQISRVRCWYYFRSRFTYFVVGLLPIVFART